MAQVALEKLNREKRDSDISDLRAAIALHTEFGEHVEATAKKRKLLELLSTPLPPVVVPPTPNVPSIGEAFRGGSGAAGTAPESPEQRPSEGDVGAQDLGKSPSPSGSSVAGCSPIIPDNSHDGVLGGNVSGGFQDASAGDEASAVRESESPISP